MSRLSRGGLASNRLWRMRSGVLAELEHRRMKLERAVKPPSIRIGQQFGGVKTESPLGIIGTLDAEAVARASAEPRREAAQHPVGITRHGLAMDLVVAVIDAQQRGLGVGQHERRFEAARSDGDAASGLRIVHSGEPTRSR